MRKVTNALERFTQILAEKKFNNTDIRDPGIYERSFGLSENQFRDI